MKLPSELVAHVDAFKTFVKTYEKKHVEGTAEFAKRLRIYAQNVKRAEEHAKLDPMAEHGDSPFMDLTEEEFKDMLGLKPLEQKHADSIRNKYAAHRTYTDEEVAAAPDNFDWREKGAVTAVKNQGQCGSCWSFSTTGALEGANFLANGKLTSLSEQQLVDCDHQCDPTGEACDSGCNGGLPANAMEYIESTGYLDTEESYPYEGFGGQCKADGSKAGARVANFTIVSNNEAQMQAALVNAGPLSIGINAAWMQTYTRGVSCPFLCSPKELDHGVLIVGYGKESFSLTRLHEHPYWTIKNSWGPMWGESGYIKVCRGRGSCGLNEMVVSVEAAKA